VSHGNPRADARPIAGAVGLRLNPIHQLRRRFGKRLTVFEGAPFAG
jgi:hypothetical protein